MFSSEKKIFLFLIIFMPGEVKGDKLIGASGLRLPPNLTQFHSIAIKPEAISIPSTM